MTEPAKQPEFRHRAFIVALTKLHARAHRIGLHGTGHALHEAVRVVGYEVAGQKPPKRRKP